ncbi:hypothetical protein EDD22DRAFT_950972 [Suillus occidentalis]|nr:hypothetical protein EDD22DRAFT_950972 [Suillus occidentalis]
MEPPSSPSSIITAPPECRETARRLAKLIVEAKACRFALLHYEGASKSMVDWFWPTNSDGERIPPSDLEIHRDAYNFRYPCCLCADGGGRRAYVESAVYPWWNKDTKKADWIPPAGILEELKGYSIHYDFEKEGSPLTALRKVKVFKAVKHRNSDILHTNAVDHLIDSNSLLQIADLKNFQHRYDLIHITRVILLQQRLPLPSESQALNQRQVMVVLSTVPSPWTVVDRLFTQNHSIGVGIFRLVVVKGIQITLDHALFILPLLSGSSLFLLSALVNQRVELASELQRTTKELETRITSITAELTFVNENVSRLKSNIKERDASISTLTTTLLSHIDEAESLREELTTLRVGHSRAFSSQTRAFQDLQTQKKRPALAA